LRWGEAQNIFAAMFRTSDADCSPTLTAKDRFVILACIGLIALGASPVVFSWEPFPTLDFFRQFPGWRLAGEVFLAAVVAGAIMIVGRLDPEQGAAKFMRYCGFILLAALLTDLHFYTVDRASMNWQIEQYGGILGHSYAAPHQYRFLPQGTLWWMILSNGDFAFSYIAYRFFFTFLVCQSIYTFAREYLAPRDAVIVVLSYGAFYQLSTRYYNGNLLDPMSHAVMLSALTCCRRGQFWPLFWLVVLGMFIKETMVVIAPCYYLMNSETLRLRDYRVLLRVGLLGVAGVAVFFACRIPFRFKYNFVTLNETSELMIWSNFGMARGRAWISVPVIHRILHPILFIFMWLPFIVWKRKLLPPSLYWTTLYLAAALYVTNLLFSWNHESRNFIPGLVLLMVCTMVIANRLVAPSQTRTEAPMETESAAHG
jgi:hypothetical protein